MGKGKKIQQRPPPQQSVDLFESSEEEELLDLNQIEENPNVANVEVTMTLPSDDDLTQMTALEEAPPADSQQQTTQETPPAPSAVPKRRRSYHVLPEEKEASVAEWYREQEFLYNKKFRSYRDKDRKSAAWENKAQELGIAGEYPYHVCFVYILFLVIASVPVIHTCLP